MAASRPEGGVQEVRHERWDEAENPGLKAFDPPSPLPGGELNARCFIAGLIEFGRRPPGLPASRRVGTESRFRSDHASLQPLGGRGARVGGEGA